ncbi:MAG: hypothetical protein ACLP9L_08670 [Thermoguttaceae bacterium]
MPQAAIRGARSFDQAMPFAAATCEGPKRIDHERHEARERTKIKAGHEIGTKQEMTIRWLPTSVPFVLFRGAGSGEDNARFWLACLHSGTVRSAVGRAGTDESVTAVFSNIVRTR